MRSRQRNQWLVAWNGAIPEDSSWEFHEDVLRLFPPINIEDNAESEEADDDMMLIDCSTIQEDSTTIRRVVVEEDDLNPNLIGGRPR